MGFASKVALQPINTYTPHPTAYRLVSRLFPGEENQPSWLRDGGRGLHRSVRVVVDHDAQDSADIYVWSSLHVCGPPALLRRSNGYNLWSAKTHTEFRSTRGVLAKALGLLCILSPGDNLGL